MFEEVLQGAAELKSPQILVPLADQGAVTILVRYVDPKGIVCVNPNREELIGIRCDKCYKLPSNFLYEGGRLSLIKEAFDVVYLSGRCSSEYWYIAKQYVMPGGYMIGLNSNRDARFSRWLSALGARIEGSAITICVI